LTVRDAPPSKGFAPVARIDAKVLVLGTLPGQVSLAKAEYYAQPRNAFWRIMGDLFAIAPDLPYASRLRALTERGVALWDVCAAAHRPGSLDASIRNEIPNDFGAFLESHRELRLICFNGAKAAQLYGRKVWPELPQPFKALRSETLPSTSPAHAAMRYEKKLALWSVVRDGPR
jgi:hypoxanthine-DNA glycosylase